MDKQRNLKFRLWDKQESKFFEPVYEAHKGNLLDISITLSGELLMRTLQEPAAHESMFPDRFIIQQYTGLKDKNGTEIYEGDICKSSHLIYDESATINEVMFIRGCWRLHKKGINDVPIFNYKPEEIEIIGNIYQPQG